MYWGILLFPPSVMQHNPLKAIPEGLEKSSVQYEGLQQQGKVAEIQDSCPLHKKK